MNDPYAYGAETAAVLILLSEQEEASNEQRY